MNWTIRNRLLAGCGLIITLLAVTCLLGWRQAANSEKQIGGILKSDQAELARLSLVEDSAQDISAARTAEMEFLLKKNLASVGTLTNKLDEVRQQLGTVIQSSRDDASKQAVTRALEIVGRYETTFKTLVDLVVRRGLTPETGLEGELRKAAHDVEAGVAKQGITELEVLLLQCRRHEKDYMLRGNPDYLAQIAKCIEEFDKQMKLFSLADEVTKPATASWKTYYDAMSNIVEVDKQIKTVSADCQQAADQFLKVQQDMQDLSASSNAAVAASQKDALRLLARGKAFLLGLLGVGLVLGTGVVWGLNRSITKPIQLVVDSISSGAEQTASAASQVTSSSQSLAEGASEQAASIEETSASLEEMSSMTRNNAESAQKANDFAKQARDAAEKGSADMQAMSEAMAAIKVSSDDIAKIIKTIDEIAFQTNILALNAAVEAARAGEAGMGFAVVADEVRNLAQRSAQAAKETADKIEGAIGKTAQGVEISTKVAQALDEIVTKVRQVDELVAEVTTASREQTEGITQINTAVGQMDKVTQTNAASAEESASAAEELNAQAEAMKESVGQLLKLVGGAGEVAPAKAATPVVRVKAAQSIVRKPAPTNGNGNGHRAPVAPVLAGVEHRRSEIPLEGDFKDF